MHTQGDFKNRPSLECFYQHGILTTPFKSRHDVWALDFEFTSGRLPLVFGSTYRPHRGFPVTMIVALMLKINMEVLSCSEQLLRTFFIQNSYYLLLMKYCSAWKPSNDLVLYCTLVHCLLSSSDLSDYRRLLVAMLCYNLDDTRGLGIEIWYLERTFAFLRLQASPEHYKLRHHSPAMIRWRVQPLSFAILPQKQKQRAPTLNCNVLLAYLL